MFTANDMDEALNRCHCNGIDDWLQNEILPRFANADSNTITISAAELSDAGWNNANWKRSMRTRGFMVEGYYTQDYFSELRYRISL